jgi:hypothetical protein
MQERGDKNKLPLQANPTSGKIMRRNELREVDETKAARAKALADKYGTQEKYIRRAYCTRLQYT